MKHHTLPELRRFYGRARNIEPGSSAQQRAWLLLRRTDGCGAIKHLLPNLQKKLAHFFLQASFPFCPQLGGLVSSKLAHPCRASLCPDQTRPGCGGQTTHPQGTDHVVRRANFSAPGGPPAGVSHDFFNSTVFRDGEIYILLNLAPGATSGVFPGCAMRLTRQSSSSSVLYTP